MEYPKMLYRGKRHPDWEAFGVAVHAKQIDTAIAANDVEEIQLREEGYGDVDTMIGEPAAAAAEPAAPADEELQPEQLEEHELAADTSAEHQEQVDPLA